MIRIHIPLDEIFPIPVDIRFGTGYRKSSLFEIIFLPYWGIGVPMVLFDELLYHEFILLS